MSREFRKDRKILPLVEQTINLGSATKLKRVYCRAPTSLDSAFEILLKLLNHSRILNL